MKTRYQRKATAAIAALALMFCTVAPAAAPAKKTTSFNVLPMIITSVTFDGTQLVANGLVGTTPFHTPITLTPSAAPAGATCPVLNLSLGPINLKLLGLNVDTSRICLSVTAHQGGGLLGDLLCSIATSLLGTSLTPALTLPQVMATLNPTQLAILSNGLTQVLNQAIFIPLSGSDALASATCSILHLELGPLDLNLLGLEVQLNNCNAGPVRLDITADPAGGLLGDLLCGLSGLLQGNATARILALLQQIANIIGGLVG